MTQERCLSAEIQNLEKPKNSSTLLGIFTSCTTAWCGHCGVAVSAGSISVIEHLQPHPLSSKLV